MIKIGFGYDIHILKEKRRLILGGIEIPHAKGLLGHSDGDALIHAIIDALLGATAKGDIGTYFPDTNPVYKDISSIILLEKTNEEIKRSGFSIVNIDSVIITELPRLEHFKQFMSNKIAETLKIDSQNVNVKAKTNEGNDAIGKGRAIAVYAVALVEK